MTRFYATVFAISRLAAGVAALAALYFICLLGVEMIARGLFSRATFVLDEFLIYAVGICAVWSLGYLIEQGDLIRVALPMNRLTARAQARMTGAAALLASGVSIGLIWMLWVRFPDGWANATMSSSVSAVPAWAAEGALMLGFHIFALSTCAHGLRQFMGHASPAEQKRLTPQYD